MQSQISQLLLLSNSCCICYHIGAELMGLNAETYSGRCMLHAGTSWMVGKLLLKQGHLVWCQA